MLAWPAKVVAGTEYSKACARERRTCQFLNRSECARYGKNLIEIGDRVRRILKVYEARYLLGGRGKISLSPEATSIA